jgi:hypothetical protein
MSISLCKSNSRAVAALLNNDCPTEPITIIRGVFETLCNCLWISSADNIAEQNERVFRLEANTLREIVKEVRQIEKDVRSSSPFWKNEEYEQLKALIEGTAKKCPWLLNSPSNGPFDFKRVPDLASRMTPEIRLRFYHLYRFSSAFTHPTPMMKTVFIHPVGSELPKDEIIKEPLQQFLAYGLWFLKLILDFSQQVFSAYDVEGRNLRDGCYQLLSQISEKGRKNYFSFPDSQRGSQQQRGRP